MNSTLVSILISHPTKVEYQKTTPDSNMANPVLILGDSGLKVTYCQIFHTRIPMQANNCQQKIPVTLLRLLHYSLGMPLGSKFFEFY